jgi:hypothetical protein
MNLQTLMDRTPTPILFAVGVLVLYAAFFARISFGRS